MHGDPLNVMKKIQPYVLMHNFDKIHCMENLLLRTANPENFSSIGQILLKISFLKAKNNSFWENYCSFELAVTEILKNILQYFKIQIR